jgi:homocysteine S-methyltransferase
LQYCSIPSATTPSDLLAIESVPSAEEAALVLELLAAWPATRAWVTFTCRDAERIDNGHPVADAIPAVTGHRQVTAVGFDFVAPSLAEELLAGAARVTTKPLVIYPNSGEQWDSVRRRWIPGEGPFDFGAGARRWLQRGARLIGGCCRTGPETIRTIRTSLHLQTDR